MFVKTVSGKIVTLFVSSSDTMTEVKHKIRNKDKQRLFFDGPCADDRTLADHMIWKGDTLHLVLRLRGGMYHASFNRQDFLMLGGVTGVETLPVRFGPGRGEASGRWRSARRTGRRTPRRGRRGGGGRDRKSVV